jgi:competence protein ComEA
VSARTFAVAVALALALVGTGADAKGKGGAKVSGVVNLNQATAAQLDLLPGVGAKAAQAIITYREKHKFTRIEELVKVKGFGKKRFAKLKPYLSVQGETTLQKEKAVKPEKEGDKTEEHASAEVR